MAIDDELDQVKQQYPEPVENVGLEGTMELLSLSPQLGPVVSVVQGLREHFSTRRAVRSYATRGPIDADVGSLRWDDNLLAYALFDNWQLATDN